MKNHRVVGKFKDEAASDPIIAYAALRAKLYSIKTARGIETVTLCIFFALTVFCLSHSVKEKGNHETHQPHTQQLHEYFGDSPAFACRAEIHPIYSSRCVCT